MNPPRTWLGKLTAVLGVLYVAARIYRVVRSIRSLEVSVTQTDSSGLIHGIRWRRFDRSPVHPGTGLYIQVEQNEAGGDLE